MPYSGDTIFWASANPSLLTEHLGCFFSLPSITCHVTTIKKRSYLFKSINCSVQLINREITVDFDTLIGACVVSVRNHWAGRRNNVVKSVVSTPRSVYDSWCCSWTLVDIEAWDLLFRWTDNAGELKVMARECLSFLRVGQQICRQWNMFFTFHWVWEAFLFTSWTHHPNNKKRGDDKFISFHVCCRWVYVHCGLDK